MHGLWQSKINPAGEEFANFASIGIQIGGIGGMALNQRRNLSELGLKALPGGTIACLMTAVIAGMLF